MISVSLKGLDKAVGKLEQVASPAQTKRILKKVGRAVLKNARERTKSQVDLKGNAYKGHARSRKRKMLTRLTRAKNMNIVALSNEKLIVGFKNSYQESIAAKQQFGFVEHFTSATAKRSGGNEGRLKDASRRQAKALITAGYQVKRASGKGFRTPSIKWITQNMNRGRAGIILRYLKGGAVSAWDTKLPSRSFLGINKQEVSELEQLVVQETKKILEKGNA